MRIPGALLVIAAWLLAIAGPAVAEPQWKTYTSEADRFEAEFPGPVEVTSQDLDDETRAFAERGTEYMSDDESHTFLVTVTRTKLDLSGTHRTDTFPTDTFECKVRARDGDVTISGLPGRETGGSQCGLGRSVLMRTVARGRTLYQAIAFVADDANAQSMAERFVASLKLLPE